MIFNLLNTLTDRPKLSITKAQGSVETRGIFTWVLLIVRDIENNTRQNRFGTIKAYNNAYLAVLQDLEQIKKEVCPHGIP